MPRDRIGSGDIGDSAVTASTLTFPERYAELFDLGCPDWEIARKLGCTLSSLERQLVRYRIPVRPLLREMAREEREI